MGCGGQNRETGHGVLGWAFIDEGTLVSEDPQRPAGQQAHRARRSACSRRVSVCKATRGGEGGHLYDCCPPPARVGTLPVSPQKPTGGTLSTSSPDLRATPPPRRLPTTDCQTLCYWVGLLSSPLPSSRREGDSVVSASTAVLPWALHTPIPRLDYFSPALLLCTCPFPGCPQHRPRMGWGLLLSGAWPQTLGDSGSSGPGGQSRLQSGEPWGGCPEKGIRVGSPLLSTLGHSPLSPEEYLSLS